MSRNRYLIVAAAFLAWITTGPGWGIDGTVTHTLHLVHRENVFVNDTTAQAEKHTLKKQMSFEIVSNEEVKIFVDDPNPLLYSYALGDITKTDTVDFQNIGKLVEQLNVLSGVLKGSTTQDTASSAARAEAAVRSLDVNMQAIIDKAAKEGVTSLTPVQQSQLNAYTAKRLQQESTEGKIKQALQKNGIDSTFLLDLSGDVKLLSDDLDSIPGLVALSAGNKVAVQGVKDTVNKWNIKGLGDRLRAATKKIDTAESEISQVVNAPGAPDLESTDPKLFGLIISKDKLPKVPESLATAEKFVKDVLAIDVPIELTKDPIPFSATQNAATKITIKVVEDNAKVAAATMPKRFQDDINLTFAPLSPVHFGFGGAVVYSFVKKSEFKAETVNGQIKIVEKKGANYTGQNIAAVLTITPRVWDNPIFGGQFQVGFNPKKNELAFFLGAGFRVFTLARIGVGVTYQEVPKLASGLVPGQTINAASDLKLDTEFKAGGYIFISVTTK